MRVYASNKGTKKMSFQTPGKNTELGSKRVASNTSISSPYQPRKQASTSVTPQKFSNTGSKVGSLENLSHTPGGGQKKIFSQKLQFDTVKSKIGSLEVFHFTQRCIFFVLYKFCLNKGKYTCEYTRYFCISLLACHLVLLMLAFMIFSILKTQYSLQTILLQAATSAFSTRKSSSRSDPRSAH